jgi:LacI family transcriptional regulator
MSSAAEKTGQRGQKSIQTLSDTSSTDVEVVTMDTIAKRARVSRSTVSRALRDHPAIPHSTRQRIKTIADELGYRPNPFVTVLMSQLKLVKRTDVTSTLALVSAFPLGTGWKDNPSVTRMVEGAIVQSNRLGYRLETFYLAEPGMTPERLSSILDTRRIPGVIILPTPESGSDLKLEWAKFCAVALGYSLASPNLHRVCNHLAHTIAKTLDNVISLGYRRIGLALRSDTDTRVDHSWRSGYLLYADMFPEVEFLPMLLTCNWNKESFCAWYLKHKPEVVITDDLSTQEWLRHLRVRIPRDVGLAHLDCSKSRHICSGIDQHHEIMGAAAVDLVVGQLYRNETGVPLHPKTVMIEGTWINGMTLVNRRRPPRRRSSRT